VICLSFISTAAICAGAYFLTEQRKADIQQQGITNRANLKLGLGGISTTNVPYGQEWWVPLAMKALENPALMEMLLKNFAPAISKMIPPGMIQTGATAAKAVTEKPKEDTTHGTL
jgi:hypothetical protein